MSAAKIVHLQNNEVPRDPNAIIEDYLEHLTAPLVGIVPFERRVRLRDEARFNIQGRMDMYLRDGYTAIDAATLSVEKYGDTRELSEQFLEEWMHYLPKGPLGRFFGLPFSYAAFFWFEATFIAQIMLIYRMMNADPQPFTFSLPLAQFRQVWPEPLPLPENSGIWITLWLYAFFAPFVAGALTGAKALTGGVKASVLAIMLLIIGSFMLGTFMLPMKDGLWFAFVQIFWWAPVGALSSHVASVLARRKRLRFHPHRKVKSYV